MKTSDKIALGALLVTIISIAGGGYVWAWTQRPVVEYQMAGNFGGDFPTDFYYNEQYSSSLPVSLQYNNRGDIDAKFNLIVSATNANISSDSWFTNNGTHATGYVLAQANSGWRTQTVDITPVGNPQNFTVTCTIQPVKGNIFSMEGLINNLAYETIHYGYTTVTYTLTSSGSYQSTYHLVS